MNKVLFIDDDPVAIMICSSIIRKNSFSKEVVSAKNGQDAIKYYETLSKSTEGEKSNYPEVIFLDLNMPIMNGWEFLDEFMNKYYPIFPKTKVVILTSSIDPTDEQRAGNYSFAIGFRSKPLTIRMLKELTELIQSNPL